MKAQSFSESVDLRAIDFNFTVEQINCLAEDATSEYNVILDKIAKQTRPTFENTIVPLARWYNGITALITATGLRYFHPDKQIRDASDEADKKYIDCVIEGYMRMDVYKAVRYVYDDQDEMIMLSAEDSRLVETIERQFRINGLQDKYVIDSANFSYVLFTREELEGVSENDIDEMAVEIEDGVEKHAVSTNVFVYNRIIKHAKREETRKRMYIACDIQEAVELRLEIANLLGYESHAESMFEGRMVKSADEIIDMYEKLRQRLSKHIDAEMDRLTAAKKADMLAEGREYTGFFEWDYFYYSYEYWGYT
ncbi:metalloendopeptidase [Coemansia sp. RSA 2336]|nr:metalloendopeptidase [Coemansia sp. RSA 2336]KAJ2456449.1 metalloendopeptidase [Coemansia sp. RSA 2336]